MIVIVHEKM